MRNMPFKKFIILFFISVKIFAQADSVSGSPDIYVIDSYITPETPNKFVLSFATSDSCIAKLTIMDKFTFDVSTKPEENHKFEIELRKLKLDSTAIKYRITAVDQHGNRTLSDIYEVDLPKGIVITPNQDVGLFSICLGGLVFSIPSPGYVMMNNKKYWTLGKELPLFSFYSGGYNYPRGYVSLEYEYIFNSEKKNFLRLGYNQIIQTPVIKYVSPGLNYFTDFLGYNGISASVSLGLFQIENVFTVYARYRYNFQPKENSLDFHEISIGLYSSFFSLNF